LRSSVNPLSPSCSRIARCLIARSARGDLRWLPLSLADETLRRHPTQGGNRRAIPDARS
jgi:hypothetical protein